MKPKLYVLTGPTAVGKTEWALRWAEHQGAEIVSCDSLLFYRQMDIGTAKPTREERARVPHHLIDICDLNERMDVSRYVRLARESVEKISARGRSVLATGGSGFYLKAFFAPVADDLAVPDAVRAEVAAMSADQAVTRLHELNPWGLGSLDLANPRRVFRALERCLASGRELRDLADEFARQPSAFADYQVELTRLDRPPEELAQRIEQRVAAMMRAGLVAEVAALRTAGLANNPSAARAIGYREVLEMLEGRIKPDGLVAEIVRNTRGLVKKQRTWFRTQLPPHRALAAGDLRDVGGLFG